MGTTTKNPGYIPAMIFGVIGIALMTVFICRCKYRARKQIKINNMMLRNIQQKPKEPLVGADDTTNKIIINNIESSLPDVDNDQLSSPIAKTPGVTHSGVAKGAAGRGSNTDYSIVVDKEKSNSSNNNCNGAQSHV